MKRFFIPFALVATLALALTAGSQDEKGDKDKDKAKDEPVARGRGYVPPTPERRRELQAISHAKHGGRIAMMAKFQTLPAAFDCREKVPLPIWDQGQCGS